MPGTIKRLWVRPTRHFKGHREHCAPGVQEAAVALVRRHVTPAAGVLDLASGSGAMLARLRDVGFCDLHGVRRCLETFGIPETPSPEGSDVCTLDLNGNFARHYDRRFALVVSVEVVEHLDSPRHFLRQARELLDDGGHLLLTTPNVVNLAWNEIGEMARAGIAFGAHTLTHADLTALPVDRIEAEALGSRTVIEQRLGVSVPGFAYPFGRFDAQSRAVVCRCFDFACSDAFALATPTSDPRALERIDMFYFRGPRRVGLVTSAWLPALAPAIAAARRIRRGVQAVRR